MRSRSAGRCIASFASAALALFASAGAAVPPRLAAGRPIAVGRGPGAPAVGAGAVWVPDSLDGTVARIDPSTGAVTARIGGLPPAPLQTDCAVNVACGYLNAALVVGSAVWVTSDYGALAARIDPSSNRIVDDVDVSPHPGGLAAGGGFVWIFHTLDSTVTRIDPATASATRYSVQGARGAGIAFARGSLWLLSVDPPALFRLDPGTLAVTARILLEPFGVRHPFRQAWSLATDGRSLWAANPNYDMVTEVDAASARVKQHVRLPRDQPFGVAVARGTVWVAARTGVVRIREKTGAVTAQLILPSVGSGYTGVAYGFGAAWVTDYDRDTVRRISFG